MTFEAHRRQLMSSFLRPAVQDAKHPVWATLTRVERQLVLTELRDALCVLALDADVGEAARVVFDLTAEGAPKMPEVFQAACGRLRAGRAAYLAGRLRP